MKKETVFIIIGIIILLVIGGFAYQGPKNDDNETLKWSSEGKKGLVDISYNDYEKILNTDELKSIVFIGSSSCSWCTKFKPIVTEIALEKSIPIYYLNLDNITQQQYNKLNTSNDYLNNNEWGTPTTLILQGKEVIDVFAGYDEKEEVENFLRSNSIIE